jgi:hypothetical protein
MSYDKKSGVTAVLVSTRLPVNLLNTTQATFSQITGAEVGFSVIEREAIVELEFSGVYQHDATAAAPTGAFDLPAVQGQVTTPVVLSNDTNWHVLPFDQIDVENDVTVLEFNGGTNAVDVKQTGLYELHYVVELDPSGISTYEFRFTKNGTTPIEGSPHHTFESSQITDVSVQVFAELTAGDAITLEYNSGGATGAEVNHAVANIVRLQSAEVASAEAEVHLTFAVDGEDVALPYTSGLISHKVNGDSQQVDLRHRCILAPGFHTAKVLWKTNNATGLGAKLRADIWPADFIVEVRSHPGTVAHGVDAKPQGVY